jgi:prophage regulatory protein
VGSNPTARSIPTVLRRIRAADRLLNARATVNFERSETTPEAIFRLRDVFQKTGLSRSTLFGRIAKRQFPHQISRGGRAVGWLKGDIEVWINELVHLRSETETGI